MQVDLIVRGICLREPGVPCVSDNVRVISIVGRFLEHSRIYYFENGGAPEVYLGSADLMPRNLDRRVEVVFPVNAPAIIGYLRHTLLAVELENNIRARVLQPDGHYIRRKPRDGEPVIDSQAWQLANPCLGGHGAPFVVHTGDG